VVHVCTFAAACNVRHQTIQQEVPESVYNYTVASQNINFVC
jgi:hypothetical protein